MRHKQGIYWGPAHAKNKVLAYIRELQPRVIKIMTEDLQPFVDAYAVLGEEARDDTIFIPRIWRIDDDNGRAGREVDARPSGAAHDHAIQTIKVVLRWAGDALDRGLVLPPMSQFVLGMENELNQHTPYSKIATASISFGETCSDNGFRALLFLLGVGHPAYPGDEPINWEEFGTPEMQKMFDAGQHIIGLHAYHQVEGPLHTWTDEEGNQREDWPYLAGRHTSCPINAAMILDECGIDGGIFDRNPGWGWADYGVSPEKYVAQLKALNDNMDPRVLAYLPFICHVQDKQWKGFDVLPIAKELTVMALDSTIVVPPSPGGVRYGRVVAVVLNVRAGPGVKYSIIGKLHEGTRVAILASKEKAGQLWHNIAGYAAAEKWVHGGWISLHDDVPIPKGGFDEAFQWILKEEGGYQNLPKDAGNWTGGAVGVGEQKGTKYGISAASYPHLDIALISKQQARTIYLDDFWNGTSAHKLDWPMSLVVFDTAVLYGGGVAEGWLAMWGPNPYAFGYGRMISAFDSEKREVFGDAWRDRTVRLMERARKT